MLDTVEMFAENLGLQGIAFEPYLAIYDFKPKSYGTDVLREHKCLALFQNPSIRS